MEEKQNKRKFDVEFKRSLVRKIEEGASWKSLLRQHKLSKETLVGWVVKYGNSSDSCYVGQAKKDDKDFIRKVVSDYERNKLSIKELVLKYKVSAGTIRNWVKRHGKGVMRVTHVKCWTDEMVEYLKSHYSESYNKDIAMTLGVSENSVRIKASTLGLKKGRDVHNGIGCNIEWTPEMIEYLKEMFPGNACRIIAEKFNLSTSAIYKKAKSLGIERDPEYLKTARGRNRKSFWFSEFQKQHDEELQKDKKKFKNLQESYKALEEENKALSETNLELQRKLASMEKVFETIKKA